MDGWPRVLASRCPGGRAKATTAKLAQLRKVTAGFEHIAKADRGVPLALAPFVIRWGETAPSDLLRRSFRCTVCGAKGATLMLPSHVGGFGPAPPHVPRPPCGTHCL
jgi:hypothetical protein